MSSDDRKGCLEHAFREARADAGLVRRVCSLCGEVEVQVDLRPSTRGPERWRRRLRRISGLLRSRPPVPRGPVCDRCDRQAAIRTKDGFLCARCAIEELPADRRWGGS